MEVGLSDPVPHRSTDNPGGRSVSRTDHAQTTQHCSRHLTVPGSGGGLSLGIARLLRLLHVAASIELAIIVIAVVIAMLFGAIAIGLLVIQTAFDHAFG